MTPLSEAPSELMEAVRAEIRAVVEKYGKEGESLIAIADRLHAERLTLMGQLGAARQRVEVAEASCERLQQHAIEMRSELDAVHQLAGIWRARAQRAEAALRATTSDRLGATE